jgi:ATP diphosphatase
VGFEWPDVSGVRAKLNEEVAEFDAATTDADRAEEMGDVLFVLANLARRHSIDPEAALRAGNAKFERRFKAMEALAGPDFPKLSLAEQEAFWQQVKAAERG